MTEAGTSVATEPAGQEPDPDRPAVAPPVPAAGAERSLRPAAEVPAEAAPAAVAAAPSVRRLAREIGVDITAVPGSGPGGRISSEDVKVFARRRLTSPDGGAAAPAPVTAALPDFTKWGGRAPNHDGDSPQDGRAYGARLGDDSACNAMCQGRYHRAGRTPPAFAPQAEEVGGKLTLTAIMLKVVVAALKRFPQFNASLDLASEVVVQEILSHWWWLIRNAGSWYR